MSAGRARNGSAIGDGKEISHGKENKEMSGGKRLINGRVMKDGGKSEDDRGKGDGLATGKPNFWKRAFWLLASFNAAILLAIVLLIVFPTGAGLPDPPSLSEHTDRSAGHASRLLVTATAADMDGIVNRLLANRQHENLRYRIKFGDPIRVLGTLEVFGQGLEMEARFRPEVMESGDLMLVTDGMRIGRLPAPASTILSYVRTYCELPDWMSIEDDGNRVILWLTRMPAGEGLELRALEMNAEQDRYRFAWTAKPVE